MPLTRTDEVFGNRSRGRAVNQGAPAARAGAMSIAVMNWVRAAFA